MKYQSTFFPLFLALILFMGCSTDVDLTQEHEDITVVIGVLDPGDTLHYIKINRTFQTEGSALEGALDRTLSEYDQLTAVIEARNGDQVIQSYALRDTTLNNKVTGTFFAPQHTVYYFNEPNLDASLRYKLIIDLNQGTKQVTAETPIVDDFSFTGVLHALPTVQLVAGTEFANVTVRWSSAVEGRRYETHTLFHYSDESAANGDTSRTSQTVTWTLPTSTSNNTSGGQAMSAGGSSEQLYELIGQQLDAILSVPGLVRRIPGQLEFVVSCAAEDLHTYMETTNPVSAFLQVEDTYTNIENGIGIFSSRRQKRFSKDITDQSLSELQNGTLGEYTGDLGFCHTGLTNTNPSSCFFGQ